MNIQKKILATTIGPIVLVGLLSIFFMLTTVRSSMMNEIEDALKGTAAATLAAYDRTPVIIWSLPTGISGREAIMSPVPRAWWTVSRIIPEWM